MVQCPAATIKNNSGAIMILLSLMILALLTIISVAASKTANIELKIAGNEYLYHNNFYCAEGAVIETVETMEALARVDVDTTAWLMNETDKEAKDSDLYQYWKSTEREDGEAGPASAAVCSDHTAFMTVHHGVIAGSSLDMSKPTKHTYSIYGHSRDRGSVLIKVGYTKAF